jgi:hypothetical protein
MAPSCMVACCACQGPCITTFKVFFLEFVRGGVLRVFRVPVSLLFKGVLCVCVCVCVCVLCVCVFVCVWVWVWWRAARARCPCITTFQVFVCVRTRVYT